MIKLVNVSVSFDATHVKIKDIIAKKLHIRKEDILNYKLFRKSIDARKKPIIMQVLTILVSVKDEENILSRCKNDINVQKYNHYEYNISICPIGKHRRPVVVGFGPAGMFAAYYLAKSGLRPIVLEKGSSVEERQKIVETFWKTGKLNPNCNVQFGEGGAGTFSDGKLTTGIKDFRIRYVLETFVKFGAPEEILYLAKPHIGTDLLINVVRNMRKEIQRLGGEIIFHANFKDYRQIDKQIDAVIYEKNENIYELQTNVCILSIGHSARDTFSMLYKKGIYLEQKNFAVGVRIEHPQAFIDKAMYGRLSDPPNLPVADYKIAVHLPNGHSLYTFCMCPGGEVVAASSEKNRLVINGMSYYKRSGKNANSALLVGVSPKEFNCTHPLAGIQLQRQLEENAFIAGGSTYAAPICCVGDFLENKISKKLGTVKPTYPLGTTFASPDSYLPKFVVQTLRLGIVAIDKKIQGFAMDDAVLTGVESRSSSPVRIVRNNKFESVSVKGLFPCGEGAGYAGGITSAAVDGLRCAEQAKAFFI